MLFQLFLPTLCCPIIGYIPSNSLSTFSFVTLFILCVSSLLFYVLLSNLELFSSKSFSCFYFLSLTPFILFTSLWCPVWVLQTQRATPTPWDGVLSSPLGRPTLGGGEAGIRALKQRMFPSGLLSPPPLPPSGKKTITPYSTHHDGCWCSLLNELLAHFCTLYCKITNSTCRMMHNCIMLNCKIRFNIDSKDFIPTSTASFTWTNTTEIIVVLSSIVLMEINLATITYSADLLG